MTPFHIPAFNFDSIPFDLSGKRDGEDCWIERICVAGSKHDLFDYLGEDVIEAIAEGVDKHLAREAAAQRADAAWAAYHQRREEAFDRCPA